MTNNKTERELMSHIMTVGLLTLVIITLFPDGSLSNNASRGWGVWLIANLIIMFEIPSLTYKYLQACYSSLLTHQLMFSMGTVRLIMVMRGIRKWAVLIGFVE